MEPRRYLPGVSFCEDALEKHGDSARGVGWPRGDAEPRYRVMLDLVRPSATPVTLLDFGCGASHFYEYLRARKAEGVVYSGLDVSPRFLELSRKKFPSVTYYEMDVLDPASAPLPVFDYVVMNGIFTYRGSLTQEAMFDYLRDLVRLLSEKARVGIAFNTITKQVDWEREDLFHLPVDKLLSFLSREISRHVVIRHDYGLYEYTAYVYKSPSAPEQSGAKRLVDGSRSS